MFDAPARFQPVVWLLAFGAWGCDETPECRLNSDCTETEMCVEGRCAVECRADRDCETHERCLTGACIDRGDPEPLCVRDSDCRPEERCQHGVCGVISLVGNDGGAIVRDAAPDPDAAFDAGTTPDASPPSDAGSPSDAGPSNLPYGAICVRGTECASTLCLGPAGAPSGRCTKSCALDSECFYPDRCVDVPGAGKFCGPSTAGRASGEPCPGGPSECSTGICVAIPGTPQFCSHQCAPLPSCPVNMSCAPVPDGAGGAIALCVPGTGLGFGQVCTMASACASGLCVGVSGAPSGVCTSFCDVVPCPAGWSCNTISDGAGGTVQVCAAGAAAGGGFGAPCTSATECASGLCLADARIGSAYCTIGCGSAADCALISGLACVVLSTGQAVCAPP